VNSAVQAKDGSIWFGFGYSTEPGGYLMRLDPEKNWQRYGANTSGYLGNEPISLFLDHDERLWVGTNGNGIQTYFREKE
jgi:streptogramin lyase